MQITEGVKSEKTDIEDTERERWRKEMRVIHDVVTKMETDRLMELYKDELIGRLILMGETEIDSALCMMERKIDSDVNQERKKGERDLSIKHFFHQQNKKKTAASLITHKLCLLYKLQQTPTYHCVAPLLLQAQLHGR